MLMLSANARRKFKESADYQRREREIIRIAHREIYYIHIYIYIHLYT